jgi:hypothetical protein
MLNLMQWEFFYLPMLHNGPLHGNSGGDDSDFSTNFANGYIQSTQHRWTLGGMDGGDFDFIMTKYFKFDQYAEGAMKKPTLREANDRTTYLANNWQKVCGGNFEYGVVTYVINPIFRDKLLISPFDSGFYDPKYTNGGGFDFQVALHSEKPSLKVSHNILLKISHNPVENLSPLIIQLKISLLTISRLPPFPIFLFCDFQNGQVPLGTTKDFLHLMYLHVTQYDYNLARIYQKWYGGGGYIDKKLFYFGE